MNSSFSTLYDLGSSPSLHWKGDWVGLHAALNMVVKKIPSFIKNQAHEYSLYGHSNTCMLITQDLLCKGGLRGLGT
jgi:hypothetical protein